MSQLLAKQFMAAQRPAIKPLLEKRSQLNHYNVETLDGVLVIVRSSSYFGWRPYFDDNDELVF